MKLQYRHLVSNGAIFRFSSEDETAVLAALVKAGLSYGTVTKSTVGYMEATAQEKKPGVKIQQVIAALGATPLD